MLFRVVVVVIGIMFALVSNGDPTWLNLDDEHRLAGRKTSDGYLKGKVVVVLRWNDEDGRARDFLPKAETVWRNFKTKSFVLLGSYVSNSDDSADIRSLLQESGVTFPVYKCAKLAKKDPKSKSIPFWYVVGITGKLVYFGKREHTAVQAAVIALTDSEAPRNDKQLREFVEFETKELPAHAYTRLKKLRENEPDKASEFKAEWKSLNSDPQIRETAEFVDAVERLKDSAIGSKQHVDSVERMLSRVPDIKKINDQRLVREIKNSIAELKWLKASL